jgi:hypothetical protein
MDLQQEWQYLNAELLHKKEAAIIETFRLDHRSHSLLGDILFKLKWKLRWIRIINIPMLIAALFIKNDLQFLLIAVFITYEMCRFFGQREFQKIKTAIDFNSTTKQVLADNLKSIQRILRMENLFGYAFLPISGPIGWLAYKLYLHQDINTVINLPNLSWQLFLCMLVGIPFIFIAQKMNDSIFKEPLSALEIKLKELND